MISVPALFSVSFCFPPHTLRLLANRRFTCMRAHILPLVSSASFAQGWAWLKKRLRVARNLLFACFPFRWVVVVPWSSLVVPWSSLPGGARGQICGRSGLNLTSAWSISCRYGLVLGSAQDAPGRHRTLQDAPGRSRTLQDAPGRYRTPQAGVSWAAMGSIWGRLS